MKPFEQFGRELILAGTILGTSLTGCAHQPDLNNNPDITTPGPESSKAEPPNGEILTEREIIEREIEQCLETGLGINPPEEKEETKIYEKVNVQEARAVLFLLNELIKHIEINDHADGFQVSLNGCQYEARGSSLQIEKTEDDEKDPTKEIKADPPNVLPYGRVEINRWTRDPDSADKEQNHKRWNGTNYFDVRIESRTGPVPGDFEILVFTSIIPDDPDKEIITNTAATLTVKDGKVTSHNFQTLLALVTRLEEIYKQEKREDEREIRKF